MRRFVAFLALLYLLASSLPLHAQTRPRRVGGGEDGSRRPPAASAPDEAAQRAGRPPTLRGADTTGDRPQAGGPESAERGPLEVGEDEVVRVNTTLVTIPVSVMDRAGRYVPNVGREEFRIWEDGVEQQVAYFATVEKPFTVALVLDTSGSTRFRLEEMQDAAVNCVNQLRPDDRVLVVSFDDEVRVLAEATSDRSLLRDAIRRTRRGEGTRLYDVVDFVINRRLNRLDGRKAVILFTDGVDTTSRSASYQSTAQDAEELDALIYPVQYDTFGQNAQSGGGQSGGGTTTRRRRGGTGIIEILADILSGGGVSVGTGGGGGGGGTNCTGCTREEYERGDRYLNELARLTGARLYRADTTRDLAGAFSLIAEELRRQYSLGYYPKQPGRAGERRRVKVRVMRPNLAVRARDSYVVGGAGAGDNTARQGNDRRPVLRRQPLAGM